MKFRKILFNQTVASTHFNNDQSFIMNKLNEASIVLPKQFLIECAYLAILALNRKYIIKILIYFSYFLYEKSYIE